MTTPQHHPSEPTFPTQHDLRVLVADMQASPLSRQLFFDSARFRSIIDLDGVVVAVNDYALHARGVDPKEIVDKPMWEDPHFRDDPLWEGRLRSRFAAALAAPDGVVEYEDRVDPPGQSPLFVRVRVSVLYGPGGVPLGFLIDSADIAREHRSRALVREQQRLLHLVFERTFQLIAILDGDGRVVDVNTAVDRIGLTREVAVGRTIMELATAEGPERVAQWQERMDAMQTAVEPRRYFDVLDPGPNGEAIATDVSMTPVRNDDGTLDLVLLEFRDQTERHQAEQRLRASEERFRALAEALPQLVWVANLEGVQYFSPNWVEYTGHPMEKLVAGEWLDFVHPDDRKPLMAEAPPGARTEQIEFRLRDRHGNYRWMETRAQAVMSEDGESRTWYGSTLDITERRESEERTRAQSQQIDAAAALTGLGSFVWEPGKRLRTDARFEHIFPYPAEEASANDLSDYFTRRVHPDDRERVDQAVAAAIVPGGPRFNQQFRWLAEGPGGTEDRWVACVFTVEFDDDGQPARVRGAVQDVTTARRQDEARVRLQKVEAIGTLVGAVAHDFNNVIGAILTYARVAEAEMAGGEQPIESVGEIARGARRAADILGRLMAFGREETPRRLRFDGAEIVDEAVALLRPAAPAGVTLEVHAPSDLPPLDGDPTQIHQVVVNLVTNAYHELRGREDGLVDVDLSLEEIDPGRASELALEPGRYVQILVNDNGPGIAEGVAHRLFDPFFTTKATGEGTGLGLAAVQSIVRAHDGSVSAESGRHGVGACFRVLLPVVADARGPVAPRTPTEPVDLELGEEPAAVEASADAPDAAVAQPSEAEPSEAKPRAGRDDVARTAPHVGPLRALFVDDEPALVRLAGRAMPYRDIEVSGFTDATEALAAFAAAPDDYDVLVTDLSMPAMSGFDLIDALREIRADLPVVLTSGYMGPADEEGAARRNVNAVLPKPCSIDALAAAVRRVTGST